MTYNPSTKTGTSREPSLGIFTAISAPPNCASANDLQQRIVRVAGDLTQGARCVSTSTNGSFAMCTARDNGSGAFIASDPETNTWLVVVGTCFDQTGICSPEHLLKQYLHTGLDALCQKLEGFFAIVIGEGTRNELVIITDIIGSCHAYVRQLCGYTAISSSSLLLACMDEVSLDPVACQEFLGMGIIYEDRSFYREIKKLPPASVITFKEGVEVQRRVYWNPPQLAPESLDPQQATEQLWAEAARAATKVRNAFEHVVCDLTGGYDSRAIAAAFLGAAASITTTVSGPAGSADVRVSTALAQRIGTRHLHFPPQGEPSFPEMQTAVRMTDGEYDVAEYSSIARIHRQLAQQFQISINGSFGEVARGYWWELLFPRIGARTPLDRHKLSARRYAWHSSNDLFRPEFKLKLVEHMAAVIERATADLAGAPNTFQMDVAYLRMRMQRWQGRIASSTNRIWPCLSPFMFRRVLETMLQAHHSVRERSLLVRRMLAQYQPALANFPLEHGYPAAPFSGQNFWRFWPLLPEYGKAVVRKSISTMGWTRTPPVTESFAKRLWKLDEFRESLLPAQLSTPTVLDDGVLNHFLEESKQAGFARQVDWNRLISIELAMATVRNARRSWRANH